MNSTPRAIKPGDFVLFKDGDQGYLYGWVVFVDDLLDHVAIAPSGTVRAMRPDDIVEVVLDEPLCGMCGQYGPHHDLCDISDEHCLNVCDHCFTEIYDAAQRAGNDAVNAAIHAYLDDRGYEWVPFYDASREVLSGLRAWLQAAGIIPPGARPNKRTHHDCLVDKICGMFEANGIKVERVGRDSTPQANPPTLTLVEKA